MMKNILKKIGGFFLDIIEAVVLALAVFVIIWLFFAQAHQVKGSSMHPSLENGDYILTDKFSYRLRDPERGEIVVFHSPRKRDDYIKRIIALPGEQVEIKNNTIYIDGVLLKEDYLPDDFVSKGQGAYTGENFFVMGDNRNHSSDSRDFGPVAKEEFVGRAILRYWPLTKFGLIKKASY